MPNHILFWINTKLGSFEFIPSSLKRGSWHAIFICEDALKKPRVNMINGPCWKTDKWLMNTLLFGTSYSLTVFWAKNRIFCIKRKNVAHVFLFSLKILHAEIKDGDLGDPLLRTIILGLKKMVCGLFSVFFLSSSISSAQLLEGGWMKTLECQICLGGS